MKSLIHEVHRRSLWQVLGIYLAGSWIALQVVEQLTEAAGLPDWVRPFSLVLLILGFPIVMATAFVQEGITSRTGESAPAADPEADPGEPLPEEAEPPAPSTPATHHKVLTWRNAILGGAGAFALLGILTAAYLFMRTAGIGPAGTLVAAGVLDERDPILIAELDAGSGDASLARTATEALRADIAESPTVTLMTADQVSEALERMRRDPDTPLDLALARELATREGIKAVIGGEVNTAGAGYVLTAQVVSTADGGVLVSRRESARDETEIIDAIDRLSKGVRERLGESLRSVQTSPPLARVTTGSLEALRKYQDGYRAVNRGDREEGLDLLYEAVAIDTAFAAAWRKIATELGNPGNPPDVRAREIEAAIKGWEHRDRLTEYEQIRAEAVYHRTVTGDLDRELAVYERGVEAFPEATPLLNNLGVQYIFREEYDRAEEVLRRALDVDSTHYFASQNLVRTLAFQGRFDETEELARRYRELYPTQFVLVALAPAARLRAERGWVRLETLLDSLERGPRGGVRRMRGQIEESLDQGRGALDRRDREGRPAAFVAAALNMAFLEAGTREQDQRAIAIIDDALTRHPLESMDPLNRPYTGLARLNAMVGRADVARSLLTAYEADVVEPLGVVWNQGWHRARSELALAEGRYDDAIAEQRLAEASPCRSGCPDLARVYDLAGVPDSAIALYTRFVDSPRPGGFGYDYARAIERLGQLYDGRGELQNAVEYYAIFVDLWSEADEGLQPRVMAAQARLEEILREIG
jgi:tetratricopeptide (TPR) repeat protein